ncbi:phosphodiesterase [Shewanella sp. Choline-02u-19]|uniref:phosphodiesterase n=1 Tax=unclassified Shewanella TaxID=196818 RepID=UPI000C339F35|nr:MULTISPECIES: phosphodiesterase [unclassified Shewanella]PKH59230.1 phosphodiesterase [Shewanella sp. Bg11-22]PKI27105.1 phosphodiesterase [Shewanella sp. Choline-02u-19]
MELFFASDLHGCFDSTQKMIAAFEQSDAKHLILLGDILNPGPRNTLPAGYAPIEVANLLNGYGDRIIAVRGNCDSEVDQVLLDFPIMSDYNLVLLPNGRRLFLTHGHLYNIANHPRLCRGDIIASGHTHVPVAAQHDDLIEFNPGSVTMPRGGHAASYGVLHNNTLSVMSFDGSQLCSLTYDE